MTAPVADRTVDPVTDEQYRLRHIYRKNAPPRAGLRLTFCGLWLNVYKLRTFRHPTKEHCGLCVLAWEQEHGREWEDA